MTNIKQRVLSVFKIFWRFPFKNCEWFFCGIYIKLHTRTYLFWNIRSDVFFSCLFNTSRHNWLCLHKFCVIRPFWEASTLNHLRGVAHRRIREQSTQKSARQHLKLKAAFCYRGSYFKYINPLHSKPHKWWLRRAFVRRIQTSETTHFKCNIKKSAYSASCAMKPVNVLVIRFNLSELYEILFYGRFECCMCVRNWKQAEYGCF